MRRFLLAAALCIAGPHLATAAPFVFFGENLTPGGTVAGDPLAARNSFLGALSAGVGTEDFEGFTNGAGTPLNLTFPGSTGSITATLSGSGTDIEAGPGSGRFATSGSQFVETPGGGDFVIDFSSAISAFGFYGTDLGDINNDLVITLRNAVTMAETDFTLDVMGSPNGSLIFWGFTDITETYDQIVFNNTPGSGDVFGFDDMTIGDVTQIVNPPSIPLPATAWLLLAGVGGLGLMRRRRKPSD
ncbi:MAG: VPLPA-CTERM sorting domain-containing protein [Pseudomonadota bacterium]